MINYREKREGSIFKLIKYLGVLTKELVFVTVGNKTQQYDPSKKVIISEKFFRSGKCKMCGRSCNVDFSLAFTESDYIRIRDSEDSDEKSELLVGLDVVTISIQKYDSLNTFPSYLYVNKNKRCDFAVPFNEDGIEKWRCSIHKIKPVHCALPLLQIDRYKKDRTRVIKRQYGRNWAFGCPVEFEPFDYDEFVNWDLYNLKRLKQNADDLGLRTWLPEIVDYLERNKEVFRKTVPDKPVAIYSKG